MFSSSETLAFSDNSDPGGQFNVMAAGESGDFVSVRSGVEAGGRPPSSDGFQTFGAMLAVARYVKIEAVPARGGSIVINEVSQRHSSPCGTIDRAQKWLPSASEWCRIGFSTTQAAPHPVRDKRKLNHA